MRRRTRKLRAGLLVRTSTRSQDPDKQTVLLQREVEIRGWTVAAVYVEKGERGHLAWPWRPELAGLLRDVHEGRIDVVLVTRVDRWSRSVVHGLAAYKTLRRRRNGGSRCHFVAVRERGIDTTICHPREVRHAIIDKLNKAEEERGRLRDRAHDVADARRAAGLPSGRHVRSDIPWFEFFELRRTGKSLRDVAEQVGVPKSTLHDGEQRILAAMGKQRIVLSEDAGAGRSGRDDGIQHPSEDRSPVGHGAEDPDDAESQRSSPRPSGHAS